MMVESMRLRRTNKLPVQKDRDASHALFNIEDQPTPLVKHKNRKTRPTRRASVVAAFPPCLYDFGWCCMMAIVAASLIKMCHDLLPIPNTNSFPFTYEPVSTSSTLTSTSAATAQQHHHHPPPTTPTTSTTPHHSLHHHQHYSLYPSTTTTHHYHHQQQ